MSGSGRRRVGRRPNAKKDLAGRVARVGETEGEVTNGDGVGQGER